MKGSNARRRLCMGRVLNSESDHGEEEPMVRNESRRMADLGFHTTDPTPANNGDTCFNMTTKRARVYFASTGWADITDAPTAKSGGGASAPSDTLSAAQIAQIHAILDVRFPPGASYLKRS